MLRDGRFYFAVFDGHNVEECAEFLKNRLHEVVEECLEGVRPDEGIGIAPPVPVAEGEAGENCGELGKTLDQYRKLVGGYWRRLKPEKLHFGTNSPLERALGRAFLETDLEFLFKEGKGGSTASVSLIRSTNIHPFWSPQSHIELVTAHVGDSRIILCETETGKAVTLTTKHHPNSPSESQRLRRFATSFSSDSFGEERFGGLGMTRAFGDAFQKRVGVSAEADVRLWTGRGEEASFLVLCTDGVSGVLGDQEIADMVKVSKTPDEAARNIISVVDAGGDRDMSDNATVMVLRLGGWERRMEGGDGVEGTRSLREWRARELREIWRRQ